MDFAKAFDKVRHFRLIKKLKAHGVDGNVEKLIFFSWLTGRRHYINDIDIDLLLKICKFADDTKIGRAVATEDEILLLRDDLKNLAK